LNFSLNLLASARGISRTKPLVLAVVGTRYFPSYFSTGATTNPHQFSSSSYSLIQTTPRFLLKNARRRVHPGRPRSAQAQRHRDAQRHHEEEEKEGREARRPQRLVRRPEQRPAESAPGRRCRGCNGGDRRGGRDFRGKGCGGGSVGGRAEGVGE